MFVYEKKLQYPVRIKNCNPRLASVIISQYGGPYSNRLQKMTGAEAPACPYSTTQRYALTIPFYRPPSLSSKNSASPSNNAFR